MRFLVPLTILSATSVMAAESWQQYLDFALPSCLSSCVGKAYESATKCGSGSITSTDSTDVDCLCNAIQNGALNDATTGITNCATSSSCSSSELQSIANIDMSQLEAQAESLCSSNSSSGSSSSSSSSSSSTASHTTTASLTTSTTAADTTTTLATSTSSSTSTPSASGTSSSDDSTQAGGAASLVSGSSSLLVAGAAILIGVAL